MRAKIRGFTILELLVVVAIIAILAVIAIPNFIGRIEEAKDSQELAEINAVEKAISTYYADKGNYPTLQGKDGTLLQAQPLGGAPHNIDFSSLVPEYLATLPHFSYWWVDYQGAVYHTDKSVGSLSGSVFTPTSDYTYTVYKTNGTTQILSAPYTLLTGEYIVGKDAKGVDLPMLTSAFKNAKMHPEDPEYVSSIAVTGVTLNKTTTTLVVNATETLTATVSPSTASNKSVTWSSSNATVATVNSSGLVTGKVSGTATITVTTLDGSKTATCVVTVSVPAPQTFAYTGGVQTLIAPYAGTFKLEVWGAQGGHGVASNSQKTGAYGGYSLGNISLTAGQTIYIYVGGAGKNYTSIVGGTIDGGWNGGGSVYSTTGSYSSGSGGGGTDVRIGGQALSNRVIVAGGGGGSADGGGSTGDGAILAGAGGGTAGQQAQVSSDPSFTRAQGGSQTAGGSGGNWGTYVAGSAGSLGQGGSALSTTGNSNGGGGGGYYGGGGATWTSGGGGSGYIGGVTSGSMTTGTRTGHGQAKITYVGP